MQIYHQVNICSLRSSAFHTFFFIKLINSWNGIPKLDFTSFFFIISRYLKFGDKFEIYLLFFLKVKKQNWRRQKLKFLFLTMIELNILWYLNEFQISSGDINDTHLPCTSLEAQQPSPSVSPCRSSDSGSPVVPIEHFTEDSPDLADVRCRLESKDLWKKFHELGTEMIITKSGRFVDL